MNSFPRSIYLGKQKYEVLQEIFGILDSPEELFQYLIEQAFLYEAPLRTRLFILKNSSNDLLLSILDKYPESFCPILSDNLGNWAVCLPQIFVKTSENPRTLSEKYGISLKRKRKLFTAKVSGGAFKALSLCVALEKEALVEWASPDMILKVSKQVS